MTSRTVDEILERGQVLEEHRAIVASSPEAARAFLRNYDVSALTAGIGFGGLGTVVMAAIAGSVPGVYAGLLVVTLGLVANTVAVLQHLRLHRRLREGRL